MNIYKQDILKHDKLTKILNYDVETGIFTNKITRNSRAVVNTVAGSLKDDGYITIMINGYKYPAHRLAWFYVYKTWPINQIDHIDGNRNNNKISNLRDVTQQENNVNIHKTWGCSVYKGVSFNEGKWRAYINYNCTRINLGRFSTEKEAAIAYNNKATELYGDVVSLNNIPVD